MMKQQLLILSIVFAFVKNSQCQVAINANGDSPDPSAGLDVSFSDKGLLIPRVSSLAVVSNPASGLLVFLTADQGIYCNQGSATVPVWVRLFPSPANGNLEMSGYNITGLASPVDGSDAVNKDYVNNAVAASGSSGPTMISNESATTLATFGDAVRYCQDLNEGGYTNWYLPSFTQLVSVISQVGATVSNRTSGNFIWTSFSDAYDGSNAQYRFMAYRMSDGFARRNWNNTASHVRCVR
jgi:hypothetical protein